ncbi:hypothetical protein [Acetatifactor muris]|uniref:hypothetical protein n=1 Tax=Acetatifactor muris TaxID=879566 RepID=UPI0023F038B5|nr:hypothetical protein [Acetatifactor muris]
MRKNLLAALLIITLFFVVAAPNSIISEASELSEITDTSENQVEFTDITLESVDIAELPVISYNNVDRPYTGETIVVDGISTHSGSNDNPNSALLFENNLGDSQALTAANEQRWYAMILSEKTKVSVYMSMDAAMDADLYVFSLDNSAGTLNLIGGSANSTSGQDEYYSAVLEAGTYFTCVTNYAGAGTYNIAYYQTNVDVNYEVNDSIETATDIVFNQKMVGALDCPYDIDLYKFTVTEYTWVYLQGSFPGKYELEVVGVTENSSYRYEGKTGSLYEFSPGTYWFRVSSKDGGYSSTVTYSMNFDKVYETNEKDGYMRTGITSEDGIEIRQSIDGRFTYVNSYKVNINYLWTNEASSSVGTHNELIAITPNDNVYCSSNIGVAHYVKSSHPINKNFGHGTVLQMTFKSNDPFYLIQWQCTGIFAGESRYCNSDVVTVLINPKNGELVDICSPNYYYTLNHVSDYGITMIENYDTITWN